MISNSDFGSISFDLPKNQSNVIKVIGVGGGGSNAINHMFKQGIKGVDFVVCNTDSQALQNSPVPNKIQLGVNLTEGLGAGANPEVGQQSALESMEDIDKLLDSNTKMIFITAGMGGGTGTGAAPVIAQMAKEKDILTVGIVTIPFQFEGKVRSEQAMSGVERLRKQVDSLIVINNNKLREVYGNLGFKAGFSKADEVLATASRGIAEVITHHYTQNIDLKDAKTVLSNSGTAIMGSAIAEGENRAKDAIVSALDSPLLNDNKITGAKNVLLLIVSGSTEITIDEIGEINDHIQAEAGYNANIIMGVGEDELLGDSIAVTIIATGFNVEQQKEIVNAEPKKIIHSLEENQTNTIDLSQKTVVPVAADVSFENETPKAVIEDKIVFELIEELEVIEPKMVSELIPTTDFIKDIEVTYEIVSPFSENQLFVTTPEVREIIVKDPEFVIVEKDQVTLSFDLSIDKTTEEAEAEKTVLFELDPIATNEIIVNEPKQVIPMTEVNETGVVRYSLEEYMEVESELLNSKPIVNVVEEPINEEMNITMKKVDTPSSFTPSFDEINPVTELTIEETLKMRADERRKKLKEFNYKFHNNSSRLDEMEKVPAYKRMGVDLPSNTPVNNQSKTSLGTDSNNDAQLRSNNSFLHDNVD
ncbi:cell division protein FtsZ [Flavobacterium piscinae]|uniref:Cell division protein FtsZ n=1 Tax=Flavobacterium piscinae TaxID=2506424 RepID=A0A4Q1KLS3_9FLAO|nr:cell division protein FtsZ [Flavobacterium piscinae]RXR29724.1 cell division protein FtsZ [Flavobacterium piscinae]